MQLYENYQTLNGYYAQVTEQLQAYQQQHINSAFTEKIIIEKLCTAGYASCTMQYVQRNVTCAIMMKILQ